MNSEATRLSSLIGHIYDAALDASHWPLTLELTADFVGGGSCNLTSTDAAHGAVDIHVDWGSDPYYVELMATRFAKIYPLPALLMAFGKVGDVVSVESFMPMAEFTRTRFYQEWARPQKLLDAIAAILEKSATTFATVSVMRFDRHGAADSRARSLMQLLSPHYRRAVAIGKILEHRAVTAANLSEALDGLAAGIFLMDGRRSLILANRAGERILAEGALLRNADGRLSATDPIANARLQQALTDLAEGQKSEGSSVLLSEGPGGRWIAHLLGMNVNSRRERKGGWLSTVALFVQKVALDRPPALEAIVNHYKLTPAELRVMLYVSENGSVGEVAPLLGISEATVRSHLHSVFEKTSTSRQSELVRLLASFASPLA